MILAIERGHTECVRALLQNGASAGSSARALARDAHNSEATVRVLHIYAWRRLRERPYALGWVKDYVERRFSPTAPYAVYQALGYAGETCKQEVLRLRQEGTELRRCLKRHGLSGDVALCTAPGEREVPTQLRQTVTELRRRLKQHGLDADVALSTAVACHVLGVAEEGEEDVVGDHEIWRAALPLWQKPRR